MWSESVQPVPLLVLPCIQSQYKRLLSLHALGIYAINYNLNICIICNTCKLHLNFVAISPFATLLFFTSSKLGVSSDFFTQVA